MNLTFLCAAPHVTVYFDSWNNWLYIEWQGTLTLPALQYACLEVAECFVKHAYPRVLNNDSQLESLPLEAAPWLAKHFFPHLQQAGIEQLAWVYAPTVRGLTHATLLTQSLPHLHLNLFADVEQATTWLQSANAACTGGHQLLPRPPAEEALLARAVAQFKQALHERGIDAVAAARA